MNKQFMSDYGVGVKVKTYFILIIFYPYGDDKCGQFIHKAVFGVN